MTRPAMPDHLVRVERWAGLRRGDPVEIAGERGRRLQWRFLAHVTNTRTGTESVEVIGGRPGEERVRSFRPDQVYRAGSLRKKGPSLASAPQLPFG